MSSRACNFDYSALNAEGNALYSAADFLGAVQKYSKGLILCTDNNTDRSTLLKNRATAYLNLREYQKVIDDTTAALEITPSDIKALYHRCQAYEQLGKYNEAFADARAVNRLNPQNSAIQPYLRRLQEIVNGSNDDVLGINSLPNEMILKIFGYLKQNQLGRIARVCKRWNVLTKSRVLWKKVDVRLSPFAGEEMIILKSFINTLPSCVTSIRLDFIKYINYWIQLDFGELSMTLQQKCPHLEELILNNSKLSNSLPSVIDLCTQFLQKVQNLVFQYCVFPAGNFERGKLGATSKIEVLVLYRCKIGRFNNPQFSRMPCLKVLCLCRSGADDTWFNQFTSKWYEETCFYEGMLLPPSYLGAAGKVVKDDTSFLNQLHVLYVGCTGITARTFQAIQKHGLNLKELYLCSINLQDRDLSFNNIVFPHLRTICLSRTGVTSGDVVSLIQSCPSLENVYVGEDVAKYFAAHPFVVANRCKSEIVKVVQPRHDHNVDYSHY